MLKPIDASVGRVAQHAWALHFGSIVRNGYFSEEPAPSVLSLCHGSPLQLAVKLRTQLRSFREDRPKRRHLHFGEIGHRFDRSTAGASLNARIGQMPT